MAKELPYLKFEPSEWLEGEIQICSDKAIVCFTNLISGYWLRLGDVTYAFALHKYCRKDAGVLQELIDNDIIEVDADKKICIDFLDSQFSDVKTISEKRSKAAKIRWSDANALQVHSKSNAIREDKIREEEKREDIYREFLHLKISKSEFDKLNEVYSKESIDDILDRIENYGNNKKYKSLVLTARSWLRKEHKTKLGTSGKANLASPII